MSRGLFFGTLAAFALLFTAFKLAGSLAWSWVWVLAPLWAVPAFVALFILAGWTARAARRWAERQW